MKSPMPYTRLMRAEFKSPVSDSLTDSVEFDYSRGLVVVTEGLSRPQTHKPISMPHPRDFWKSANDFLLASREGRLTP
jgi:hypothetical protein